METQQKRSTFTGSIGFVLAATVYVVYKGVDSGIERLSKVLLLQSLGLFL